MKCNFPGRSTGLVRSPLFRTLSLCSPFENPMSDYSYPYFQIITDLLLVCSATPHNVMPEMQGQGAVLHFRFRQIRGFLNQLEISGQISNNLRNFFGVGLWRGVSSVFSTEIVKITYSHWILRQRTSKTIQKSMR